MSLDHLNPNEPVQPENSNNEIYTAFEDVQIPTQDEPQRKVNPLIIYLTVAAIAVVVLACVFLAFKLLLNTDAENTDTENTSGETTDSTDETSKGILTLLDKSDKGKMVLRQVDIQNNAHGSLTVYYNEKDGKFLLKGYEDIELSKEIIDLLKEYTTTFIATEKVENPKALKDYGLDKPAATATITYADKSTVTIKIGKELPSKDGYYGMLDAKDGVYMFDADCVSLFRLSSAAGFADTVLVSSPTVKSDDAYGSVVVKEIRYSGKKHPTPFSLRRSYHTDSEELQLFNYIISKPYLRATSDEAAGYLSSFKSLSASQALYLHPTDSQKNKLGFDDPLTRMEITMAVETSESDAEDAPNTYYHETTVMLTVGTVDKDGNYLVMVEGIDAIFFVENNLLSSIADRTYDNTVNQLLFLKNIDDLGSISIEIDGKTSVFDMKHYPKAELLNDQLKVTVGDKTMSTPDFRELYQLLMGLERMDKQETKPTTDPVMVVKMYTNDGAFYMGATYYSMSGTLCAVETTEGELFATRWRNVTHFIEQVQNLLNGEKVLIMTY